MTTNGKTAASCGAVVEDKRKVTEIKARTRTSWDMLKMTLHQNNYSPYKREGVRQYARQGSNEKQVAGKTQKEGDCTRLTKTITCNAGFSLPSHMCPSPLVEAMEPSCQSDRLSRGKSVERVD